MQSASMLASMFSWFTSHSSVFLTVISGVLIFVLGQLLLKGILEPALDLKDRIAEISKQLHLLVHQRSFIDEEYGITENDIKIIGELSAEIRSLPYRILMYSRIRCLLDLPSRENLKEVCCKLHELSYSLRDLKSTQEQREVDPSIRVPIIEGRQDLRWKSIEKTEELIPEIEKLLGITNPRQPPTSPSRNPQATR